MEIKKLTITAKIDLGSGIPEEIILDIHGEQAQKYLPLIFRDINTRALSNTYKPYSESGVKEIRLSSLKVGDRFKFYGNPNTHYIDEKQKRHKLDYFYNRNTIFKVIKVNPCSTRCKNISPGRAHNNKRKSYLFSHTGFQGGTRNVDPLVIIVS